MQKIDYHIHSLFSDGKNSIEEIAQFCSQNGFSEIAITDHVRRVMDYDFSIYQNTIKNAYKNYGLKILLGVEAKILPNGELDIPQDVRKEAQIIIGSVHSWPEEKDLETAYDMLCKSDCTIIGHVKYLDRVFVEEIIKNKKILEINYQYPLSIDHLNLLREYPKLKVSFGSNAHEIGNLLKAQDYFSYIKENFILDSQLVNLRSN